MGEFSISDKANKAAAAQPPDLEFPIARRFYSPPPRLSPAEYYQWCREMAAARPDDPADRFAEKCAVEFIL
jgi:hypothetical protein